MIYACAGFGAGNLGDDAIFEGMLKEYPGLIQIYVNLPSHEPSIWYSDLIEQGFPEEARGGELIIGGGGILHSREAIENYIRVAEKAKEKDMLISLRKFGAEYLQSEYEDVTKIICDMAYYISVRSKKSKEILNSMGVDKEIIVDKDYAYSLKDDFFKAGLPQAFPDFPFNAFKPSKIQSRYIIGLVTSGNKDNIDKLTTLLRFLLTDQGVGAIFTNVVHIPHVRHYVDYQTNDVITGERLWSSVDIYHDNRYHKFKPLPWVENCYSLLNVYTRVHGIIGLRYHSFVFSEMANLPLLGLVAGPKAIAYAEECNRKDAIFVDIGDPIWKIVEAAHKFIRLVKGFDDSYAENELKELIGRLENGGNLS